jgi:hypothetical protein
VILQNGSPFNVDCAWTAKIMDKVLICRKALD